MRNKYTGRPVLRTPLIVAGHNDKYIDKAFQSDCDCIVFDVEDGVPENFKPDARANIKKTLQSSKPDHRPIFVRINSLETGQTQMDVDGVACPELDGFLYTKPYTAKDIKTFDNILSQKEDELKIAHGHFKIIVIIETPASVMHVEEISLASERIIGLLFGSEDLLGDMEGFHGPGGRSLQAARSQVLMACRAANIIPIDTPYIQVHNDEGLREFILPALELGYEGMLLISPSQIPIAKEMYTPKEDKVNEAYEMLKISNQNAQTGTGVSVVKKMFVSPPTLKRAMNIVKRYENIVNFEKMK